MFGKKIYFRIFYVKKDMLFLDLQQADVSMRMAKGQEKIRNVVCCLKKKNPQQ